MGVGGSWGTREELLHPRDRHGRFRSKWKMAEGVVDKLMAVLDAFSPRMFRSDQEAGDYAGSRGFRMKRGENREGAVRAFFGGYSKVNDDVRAGKVTPEAVAIERAMQPTDEDLILSRTVGPEAFGLDATNIDQIEEYTGKLLVDRGFSSVQLGTPSRRPGTITITYATPKGTPAVFPWNSPGHPTREVILDRDQPFRITKVEPDGQGGFSVYAVVEPKGTGGRPKAMGTKAPARTAPPIEQAPGGVPAAPQVPVQTGGPGRPEVPPAPRAEPVVSEAIGGAPQAPGAPEVPSPAAPVNFRQAVRDADLPVPSRGPRRREWNEAQLGLTIRRREPQEVLRELEKDIEVNQRTLDEGNGDRELPGDIEAQQKLADLIHEQYGIPKKEGAVTPVPKPAPATEAPPAPEMPAAAKHRRGGGGNITVSREERAAIRRDQRARGTRGPEEPRKPMPTPEVPEPTPEGQAILDKGGITDKPKTDMGIAAVGLTVDQVAHKKLSKKKAGERLRKFADSKTAGEDADLMRQIADVIDPPKMATPTKKAAPVKKAVPEAPSKAPEAPSASELQTRALADIKAAPNMESRAGADAVRDARSKIEAGEDPDEVAANLRRRAADIKRRQMTNDDVLTGRLQHDDDSLKAMRDSDVRNLNDLADNLSPRGAKKVPAKKATGFERVMGGPVQPGEFQRTPGQPGRRAVKKVAPEGALATTPKAEAVAGRKPTLDELRDMKVVELRAEAKKHGIRVSATRKADIAEEIARELGIEGGPSGPAVSAPELDADLKAATVAQLRDIAAKENIDLPKSIRLKADIQQHIHGARRSGAPARAARKKATPAGHLPQAEQNVVDAVREIERDRSSQPGEFVPIAALRDKLAERGMSRTEQDVVLRSLARDPDNGVRIIPVANRKSLTARDRDAAFRLGDEDNHAIAVEPGVGEVREAAAPDRSTPPLRLAEVETSARAELKNVNSPEGVAIALDRMTIAQLREEAKSKGIKVPSNLKRKAEIRDYIARTGVPLDTFKPTPEVPDAFQEAAAAAQRGEVQRILIRDNDLAEAVRNASPADLRQIARDAGADVSDDENDKDAILTAMARAIARQELASRKTKRTKAAKKVTEAVAPASPSADLDELVRDLDPELLAARPAILEEVRNGLLDPKKTPAQVGRDLEQVAQGIENSTAIRYGSWDRGGILGPVDPEHKAETKRLYDRGIAESAELRKLADRLKATRRKPAKKIAPSAPPQDIPAEVLAQMQQGRDIRAPGQHWTQKQIDDLSRLGPTGYLPWYEHEIKQKLKFRPEDYDDPSAPGGKVDARIRGFFQNKVPIEDVVKELERTRSEQTKAAAKKIVGTPSPSTPKFSSSSVVGDPHTRGASSAMSNAQERLRRGEDPREIAEQLRRDAASLRSEPVTNDDILDRLTHDPDSLRSMRTADVRRLRELATHIAKMRTTSAAKKAVTPAPPAPVRTSPKELLPNNWGVPGGEINFHPDGVIGYELERMGDDLHLEVRDDALGNVIGRLATRNVRGQMTSQEVLDELKKLRDEVPEASKARVSLNRMIQDLDAPSVEEFLPISKLPDGTPEPLRQLQQDLIKIPLVRRGGKAHGSGTFNYTEELADILRRWRNQELSPLGFMAAVRELHNRHHESVEGKFEVDRAVAKAIEAMERLFKDRDARKVLYPPGHKPS